jgi:oligopeptidase B
MVCRQLPITVSDGTKVPITIMHKKSLQIDANTPLLVEVYGSYGESLQNEFQPYVYPLLRRNWVFASVHVRGGGEFGNDWHHAGRLSNKMNTFTDFMESIDFLHSLNISSPKYTAAIGGSAGAVPIAVTINNKPSLLAAAILRRPFLNVLGSLMDQSSHLHQQNCEEWGNPTESPEMHRFISSYSPLDNLNKESITHTAVLCMPALGDHRTPISHSLQYVRQFRILQSATLPSSNDSTNDAENIKKVSAVRPCLMYSSLTTGHMSGSGSYEEAVISSFLYCVLRLGYPPSIEILAKENENISI